MRISPPTVLFKVRDLGDYFKPPNYYLLKRLRHRCKQISLDQFLINSYLLEELLDIEEPVTRDIKIICRRIDRHTCCADSFGIDYKEELT